MTTNIKQQIEELKIEIEDFHVRTCCICDETMWAGWHNEDSGEYYCSDSHMREDFTEEEQEEAEERTTLWATMWEEEQEEYDTLIERLEELENLL